MLYVKPMKSPDSHWRGRTQDWDTIQRIRAVLHLGSKKTRVGVEILFPHSSARRHPESQQWSADGAAQAGLIHALLVQAGGWRNEEVEGHSHQDNHHNSGVWCADKWLMAAIILAQEKRGYYRCCRGDGCFALYKLEVQRDNAPYLMEKQDHHSKQLLLYSSVCVPNKWKLLCSSECW